MIFLQQKSLYLRARGLEENCIMASDGFRLLSDNIGRLKMEAPSATM
ncbi:MAG: hypothetical protein NTV62_02095 [Candidatus Gribaldobacteria bacterium]|nr:hypothetical protein [Candidatus Gribaldobacteria bacterium]